MHPGVKHYLAVVAVAATEGARQGAQRSAGISETPRQRGPLDAFIFYNDVEIEC